MKNHLLVAIATIAALFGILLFPDHPESFSAKHFARVPLEWPLIVLALLLLRGAILNTLRWLLVAVLALAVLLRTADIGSYIAFDRRFSPLVEWHLLGDGWNLASQQVGLVEAGLAVALVIIVIVILLFVLFKGLGAISKLQGSARTAIGIIAAILFLAGLLSLQIPNANSTQRYAQASFIPELIDRSKGMQRSIIDQQDFVIELATDPLSNQSLPTFSALAGLDVAFVFIESYGQSFLLDEQLGPPAAQRLATIEQQITDSGLHVRSGWITSPVRGGRSWLAHASFASGLNISNQARFDRLVVSDRTSLYGLFSQAGWNSAGLVPAIREAWPEGVWYGFDQVYDLEGMDYKGEAFGWVTMPDQYTLSAFETNIREASEHPVMAEIALISSHAPWTPIPELVPWNTVEDGSVFDGSNRFGEPMTWGNRSKVREMYAKSLDYSLATVGEYLSQFGKGGLFVILGDHQPASIIAGWGKTADVPVHIVSDDPALLERLPADVFHSGMFPEKDSRSLPMWSVRELMSSVFETVGSDE